MSVQRKLLIGLLIVVEIGLLAAMVAVLRPVDPNLGWWGVNWPDWFGAGAKETETVMLEFEIDQETVIDVRNDVGTVRVVGGEPGLVRVVAEKVAFGVNREQAANRLLREVQLDLRAENGRLVIEGRTRDRAGLRRDRVDLEIRVPPESNLGVDAEMGRVWLRDFSGDAAVRAAMGTVEVADFRGNLEIDASMGRVNVRRAMIDDRLQIEAGMGQVVFEGWPGTSGFIETGMGSIEVRLPPETSLLLDADLGLGRLTVALPLRGEQTERSFKGELGPDEPQGTLTIRAGMGTVQIK